MIRRPPRSTPLYSSAASDVYKRQLFHCLGWVDLRYPGALVPDDDRAAAIFALGNGALERRIVDRVILDMHGQPLFMRIEARAARHRPAPQYAVMFQAK